MVKKSNEVKILTSQKWKKKVKKKNMGQPSRACQICKSSHENKISK